LPTELARLEKLLDRGLTATAALWLPIRTAYGWVHEAARLLDEETTLSVFERRRQYRALLATMSRERGSVGELEPVVAHFLKVTKSYWRGLFHCYEIPELPRTNNELEQTFGAVRHAERRATGRKSASPGLVVRGAVRVIAAVVTRLVRFGPAQLRPHDPAALAQMRQELEQRQEARRAQYRFRRDPDAYLQRAESLLLGSSLPP
jgi:hypothetical protein